MLLAPSSSATPDELQPVSKSLVVPILSERPLFLSPNPSLLCYGNRAQCPNVFHDWKHILGHDPSSSHLGREFLIRHRAFVGSAR